jgi:hypothetical protein
VVGRYDVAVVGGGVAGVAAAVAASRNGASVCLVEKMCAVGGLATLGNVTVYLPLCDGAGNQVIGGLAEEFLKLSVRPGFPNATREGARVLPDCWRRRGSGAERAKHRYVTEFNPTSFALELEALLVRSGVTLFYDTRFCDTIQTGRRIRALVLENKDGRVAVACGTAVDASGDADVCQASGERTRSLDTNVRCGWHYFHDGASLLLDKYTVHFDRAGLRARGSGRGYAGDRAADVTALLVDSRRETVRRLRRLQVKASGKIAPVGVPTLPPFRMTRRLKGAVELSETNERQWFDDCVGMMGDWRRSGPVYYLPLRSLVGAKTDNLVVAGRCISTTDAAWDAARAIPVCVLTGEVAGTACAMAAEGTNGSVRRLPYDALRGQLVRQKVMIDPKYSKDRDASGVGISH